MSSPRFALLGLIVAFAVPAQAARYLDDRLSINGFGTLGAVYNHNDNAEFIRDITQTRGPAGGWSGDVDSRFGLQLGWRFTSELDAVVQAVSRYNHKGNYDPQLTWAFLRYNPNPAIQLRLGRVGLDTYMLSDSRDVGYSYLWMRPPVDYYGVRHITHLDGLDLVLRRPVGDGLLWGKLYAGRADERIASELDGLILDSAGSQMYGGHINYEQGSWRFQLGAMELRYKLKAPTLYTETIAELDAFARLPVFPGEVPAQALAARAEAGALASVLRDIIEPITMQLTSLGVAYDRGRFQAQAMLGYANRPGDEVDTTSGFVTFGYRIDKVTPYLTLSGTHTDGYNLRQLGLGLNGEYGVTQKTLSFGARYDIAANLALKTQLDFSDVEQTGLLWRKSDPAWQGTATLFSLGLDFFF